MAICCCRVSGPATVRHIMRRPLGIRARNLRRTGIWYHGRPRRLTHLMYFSVVASCRRKFIHPARGSPSGVLGDILGSEPPGRVGCQEGADRLVRNTCAQPPSGCAIKALPTSVKEPSVRYVGRVLNTLCSGHYMHRPAHPSSLVRSVSVAIASIISVSPMRAWHARHRLSPFALENLKKMKISISNR